MVLRGVTRGVTRCEIEVVSRKSRRGKGLKNLKGSPGNVFADRARLFDS
jgi:hypothetical protein